MASIPPNQKMMLLSALGILSAGLAELLKHYQDPKDHQLHDLIENFNIGLTGFTAEIMKL